MNEKKILVVDDEQHIQELIKYNLEVNGFVVETVGTGEKALEVVSTFKPNLIILDLMLPGIDGLDVCKTLKKKKETKLIPILMLTAKSDELDKVLGLEMGADDYLTKPFSIRELGARVKAILRRLNPEDDESIIRFGNVLIDDKKREVYVNDELVEFALKEYEILKLLAQNRGKVLSREHLLEKIWGYKYYGETRTVDVHIRHIRQRIEGENKMQLIETVRGIGYKLIVKGE